MSEKEEQIVEQVAAPEAAASVAPEEPKPVQAPEEPKEQKPKAKRSSKKAETKEQAEQVAETPVQETPAPAAPAPEPPVEEAPKVEQEREVLPEEMIFGKYSTRGIVVEDPSLKGFINLDPVLVPHSSARHANKPFYKHKLPLVERLINNLMRTENYTGKKSKSYRVVLDALKLVEQRTKENPIQILVKAVENAAPREEVTRLKFGGISVPKAVDTAPSRRIDIALRNISMGTIKASHKNKKSISQCLASELMAAAKGDMQSFAVSRKDELERVAKSAH